MSRNVYNTSNLATLSPTEGQTVREGGEEREGSEEN